MDNSISNRLKTLRKNKNLSQAGLGIALGISRSQISNWELGRRQLTIEDAIRIAKYFNISLDEFVGNEDEK